MNIEDNGIENLSLENENLPKKSWIKRLRTEEKRVSLPLKILLGVFVILLILADQLSKWWVLNNVKGNPIYIIKDIFHFEYHENTGVAFGFFENSVFVVLGLTTALILVGVIVLFSDMLYKSKLMYIAGGLIVAGGIGNLIDRYFRRFVVDFISVTAISFPIFNVADMCVVVGAILLMIAVLFVVPSEPLAPLAPIEAGFVEEKLKTGEDAEAEIDYQDNSLLKIDENVTAAIAEDENKEE